MKEYIQKRNEEIKKNQQNDKNKNQSTAYRPTHLPVPMPMQGQVKTDEMMTSADGLTAQQMTPGTPIDEQHNYESEQDETKQESQSPMKSEHLPIE